MRKEQFAEAHTSQHMKGHVMKDSSLMTHMYLSALHCTVEFHFFHRLRLIDSTMSAETDACTEARHVLTEDLWRTHGVWRKYKKDSEQ